MSTETVPCGCTEDGGPPITDCSACAGSGMVVAACEPTSHNFVTNEDGDTICTICDALRFEDGFIMWQRRVSKRRRAPQ